MAYSTASGTISGARIENQKKVTIEFVNKEGDEIWRECKEAFTNGTVPFGDMAAAQTLLTDIRRRHKDFATSYPIVVRYMCEMRVYHSKAFYKFLRRIELNPWKSEEEYLDAQADYVTLLYKHTTPRFDSRAAAQVRTEVRELLRQEHKLFKEQYEVIKTEVEQREKVLKEKSVDELIEYVRRTKKAAEGLPNSG